MFKKAQKQIVKKKIYRGMFRPRWEDIFNEIVTAHKKTSDDPPESVLHRCQCGMMVQLHYLRDHWQQGHYDTPVYQEIDE